MDRLLFTSCKKGYARHFCLIAHPMYTGIILVIISCSLVYITRLPIWLSALGLICCFYIVGFLIMAALREDRQLVQA